MTVTNVSTKHMQSAQNKLVIYLTLMTKAQEVLAESKKDFDKAAITSEIKDCPAKEQLHRSISVTYGYLDKQMEVINQVFSNRIMYGMLKTAPISQEGKQALLDAVVNYFKR